MFYVSHFFVIVGDGGVLAISLLLLAMVVFLCDFLFDIFGIEICLL